MISNSSPFHRRGVVLLVDPDRVTASEAGSLIRLAAASAFSGAWIGGTFLHGTRGSDVACAAIEAGKAGGLPIFTILGLSSADALVVSGLSGVLLPLVGTLSAGGELIHQAYRATPVLAAIGAPVVPIAYLLVDGGLVTSATHGLQGVPLPRDKPEIAATLARCGEFMGAKAVYLDAGSGAPNMVPVAIVEAVRSAIRVPLIVGGGMRRPEQAATSFAAGADIVVIGSAFESGGSGSLFESFGAISMAVR